MSQWLKVYRLCNDMYFQLLHALGFNHEHQRPDRDKFITINTSIIPYNLRSQYTTIEKYLFPAGSLSMQYDIHSIMHYDSFNNEKYNQKNPVILTRNNDIIKVNTKMSPIDIAKLNQMYPPKENSSAENTCNNLKNQNQRLLETNKRLSENDKKCSEDKKKCMNHLSEQKTFNLPVNQDVTLQELPQWSSWSPYSKCSASCGLGIKFRTRICRPVYNRKLNKIIQCEDQNYDYQTCYERKCPSLSDDRTIQCKRYGESINKRLDPVEAPSNSPNKCLLYCKDSNGRTFNTGKYVRNGTPCSYDSDDHFCIFNECKRVGCDNKIGSTKKYNKCGICGGTDSQCQHFTREKKGIRSSAPESKLNIFIAKDFLDSAQIIE